jgi:L-seryl-tRNA(Ser) seleniumtransferase
MTYCSPVEFGKLPKVDRVVDAPALDACRVALGRSALVVLARDVLAEFRARIKGGAMAPLEPDVVEAVRRAAVRRQSAAPRPVVNATGVLLHTNLGRAPLPESSIANVARVARGYSSLEFDIEIGERIRRSIAVESALATLVGAESALVVNNNAAAVLLALTAVAAGREVIVSRGELVEIGGGFRIPEILARSTATLVEIGTTNRTRVDDYERALNECTGAVLRVHPSNFVMSGFVERPSLAALSEMTRHRAIPLIEDLGGGFVVEHADEAGLSGLANEPTVQSSLRAGADLVCFSLDKLFGGPQGGAVVGGSSLVDRLRKDPLARAVRVDKLTLAALEPVIDAYVKRDYDGIPILARLRTSEGNLRERVEDWRRTLGRFAAELAVVNVVSETGGGTLSEGTPSPALAVTVASPDDFARRLREQDPPVVARIGAGKVLLDPRTVMPGEDDAVVRALAAALAG